MCFATYALFSGGDMGRLENDYKRELKKRMESRLPGRLILKNDEQMIQGIPDMIILWGSFYVVLEVKRNRDAPQRPNQQYWLDYVSAMGGFAFVIYPENEAQVLDEIQRAFQS